MENLNSMQSNNQVLTDSPMTTVKIPRTTTNNFEELERFKSDILFTVGHVMAETC